MLQSNRDRMNEFDRNRFRDKKQLRWIPLYIAVMIVAYIAAILYLIG